MIEYLVYFDLHNQYGFALCRYIYEFQMNRMLLWTILFHDVLCNRKYNRYYL